MSKEKKERKVMRPGKTQRDRDSGQHSRNLSNRRERAAWQNDSRGSKFPSHTCNGKRNRNRWTGKGGKVVVK